MEIGCSRFYAALQGIKSGTIKIPNKHNIAIYKTIMNGLWYKRTSARVQACFQKPLWSLLHWCKNVETSRNPVYSYLYITMPNTFGYIFILKVIYHFHLSWKIIIYSFLQNSYRVRNTGSFLHQSWIIWWLQRNDMYNSSI